MTAHHPALPMSASARRSALLTTFFIAFVFLALLRIALVPSLLDHVINYTADSGSLIEKIHPTFWGFAGVAFAALSTQRILLTHWELRVLRAALLFGAGIVMLLAVAALTGQANSAGYLIDSYFAGFFALILFVFPPEWRRIAGLTLLGYLTLGALVGIAEFATRTRVLPYDAIEATFRPTGLANHPLEFGLNCATAVGFVAASGWTARVRVAALAVLVAGGLVAGARLAGIMGLASALVVTVWQIGQGRPTRRRAAELRVLTVLLAFIAVPALLGVLGAAGALDRFQGGLVDESAMARVSIYGIFSDLSWGELLFGADLDHVRQVALERYGFRFIESSLVIFVVQFGAVGTALFLGLLGNLVRVLLAGAGFGLWLGTIVFFVVSASNNGLSTKNAGIFLVFSLIIALRPARAPEQDAS